MDGLTRGEEQAIHRISAMQSELAGLIGSEMVYVLLTNEIQKIENKARERLILRGVSSECFA